MTTHKTLHCHREGSTVLRVVHRRQPTWVEGRMQCIDVFDSEYGQDGVKGWTFISRRTTLEQAINDL